MNTLKFVVIFLIFIQIYSLKSLNQYPLDSNYHKWETIADSLRKYDNILGSNSQIEIIGYSGTENLPIEAIHIHKPKSSFTNKLKKLSPFNSSNLWDLALRDSVKKVLIIGQHHGEEPIGIEIAMAFLKSLTQESENIDKLLENYYFTIIPTINPEAFRIVSNGEYPLRRKNCRDTNHNGIFDMVTDGVDLNKNYPSNWKKANLKDVNNQYYKGESAASEPEVQAVISLAEREEYEYAFLYHSSSTGAYSEVIFFPYNWLHEKSKHWSELKSFADSLAFMLPRQFLEGNYEVYTGETSQFGYARDYLYRNYGTFALTIEVGALTATNEVMYFPQNKKLDKIILEHINSLHNILRY
ncbi:MAG: hypothetical protein B6226_03250 [Candidatus Cloacimonetes bacterium 4572_65]|nr:MAG: hypothetical protein B6226_03250 [Candidatus Cloacimonetes bacterium 4572_65]